MPISSMSGDGEEEVGCHLFGGKGKGLVQARIRGWNPSYLPLIQTLVTVWCEDGTLR